VAARFYPGEETAAFDYGEASTGEPRDLTDPDPVCP